MKREFSGGISHGASPGICERGRRQPNTQQEKAPLHGRAEWGLVLLGAGG